MDGSIRATLACGICDTTSGVGTTAGGSRSSPYLFIATCPTLEGTARIRFDLNHGAGVAVPDVEEGEWRVRLRALDTDNLLCESENVGALVTSAKRYFVRFTIDVYLLTAGALPPRFAVMTTTLAITGS